MQIKLNGTFTGKAAATKKGTGFIRTFIHEGKDVFKVFSRDAQLLEGNSLTVTVGDMVFAGE